MPKKPLTEEQVREVRHRIMDAAADLMAVDGVQGLSMRNLSKELGMTAANIYNYFPNKNQLYQQTTQRGYELLAEEVEQCKAAAAGKGTRAELLATMKASANFATAKKGYWELIFHPPIFLRETDDEEFIETDNLLRKQTFDRMIEAFNSVQAWYREKGISNEVLLATKTIAALTTIHGLIDLHNHRILQNFGLQSDALDELVDMILADLFPE